jgi:hypothetical protein
MECVYCAEIIVNLFIIDTQEGLFQFSCSPLEAVYRRFNLPDIVLIDEELTVLAGANQFPSSNPNLVYIFPVSSESVNCSGRVSALRYCYRERANVEFTFDSELFVFTFLILEQSGSNFTVTNSIVVNSSPNGKICSMSQTVDTDLQSCCDTIFISEADKFFIPSSNFAFGITGNGSTVDLLRFNEFTPDFSRFLVEHYRPTVEDFSTVAVGNVYVSSGTPFNDSTIRLLQFVIGKATTC